MKVYKEKRALEIYKRKSRQEQELGYSPPSRLETRERHNTISENINSTARDRTLTLPQKKPHTLARRTAAPALNTLGALDDEVDKKSVSSQQSSESY